MILKLNDHGLPVEKLQRALLSHGFSPGSIDGFFGMATEAAVIAFQRSAGLLADGIVGPRTLRSLNLLDLLVASSFSEQLTTRQVAQLFPFTPIDNISENLPFLKRAFERHEMEDKEMVLVALATIRAESEGFEPISEGKSRFNTSPGGHPFNLYDNRADLGNQGKPDGERFKGRGFIQITGRFNYKKYSEALGMGSNLIDEPELANDPSVAADILVLFLKQKERAIKEALLDGNLKTVRRLVNGGLHGWERFSETYNKGKQLFA